ncbi:MAG: fibrobacter succinogenes major paralogous domain-containing protein, partial [Paludibacter sp.]|nr:fibrobacter succinogenes major paralogous domain-containing protein [Paludibacter sp.]
FKVYGKVSSDGGDAVMEMGVCMSKHPIPTIDDTKKTFADAESIYPLRYLTERQSVSGSAASFKVEFFNLERYTTYYFRAYAMNSAGIGYGEVIEMNTYELPAFKNIGALALNRTDAVMKADIDPQNSETEVWFEVYRSGEAVRRIDVPKVSGQEVVTISAQVAGLTPGEVYNYVVKAKNAKGVITGETKTFRLFHDQVTDYEGNKYWTVKIGDQIWLAENLRTKHFLNGDPIPNVQNLDKWIELKTPAWCYYTNNPELGLIYGALYNISVGIDPRGLISGFHVPSIDECQTLVGILGGELNATIKLKSAGDNWFFADAKGDNSSGFNAMPGGWRGNSDMFSGLSYYVVFQTTTSFMGYYTYFSIGQKYADASGGGYNEGYNGCYIRLIKD